MTLAPPTSPIDRKARPDGYYPADAANWINTRAFLLRHCRCNPSRSLRGPGTRHGRSCRQAETRPDHRSHAHPRAARFRRYGRAAQPRLPLAVDDGRRLRGRQAGEARELHLQRHGTGLTERAHPANSRQTGRSRCGRDRFGRTVRPALQGEVRHEAACCARHDTAYQGAMMVRARHVDPRETEEYCAALPASRRPVA